MTKDESLSAMTTTPKDALNAEELADGWLHFRHGPEQMAWHRRWLKEKDAAIAQIQADKVALENKFKAMEADRDMWMDILGTGPKEAVIVSLKTEIDRLKSKHQKFCNVVKGVDPYGECTCGAESGVPLIDDSDAVQRAESAEAQLACVVEALKPFAQLGALSAFHGDGYVRLRTGDDAKGTAINMKCFRDANDVLCHLPAAAAALMERVKVADAICAEIVGIMRTYDEQVAKSGYPDTPGGLEHMGDVWGLLDGWREAIKRAASEGK